MPREPLTQTPPARVEIPLTADELLEMGRFATGFYEANPDLLRDLLRTALAEVERLQTDLEIAEKDLRTLTEI